MAGLMPLLRRCLEYIVYVFVATFVLLQVEFISHFATYGPQVVKAIGIYFLSKVIIEVANLLVDKSMGKTDDLTESERQRQLTIVPIIKSLLKYSVYFAAFVLILRAFDLNPMPLLAGAGILGVVVGFGAQPLINDIVSGFFILFENIFLVGDFVETAEARGTVEAIEIRTTRIRNPDGHVHILRNGQIGAVVNYSKEYTHAVVEVGVAYDSNLDHVYRILSETGEKLKEKNPSVLEKTEVRGLKNFGESELLVRTITKVKPGRHRGVARELRKMIKEAFDAEGIEIPFARRVIIFQNEGEDADKFKQAAPASPPDIQETPE
jgi:small conductance mechanosensitive channel